MIPLNIVSVRKAVGSTLQSYLEAAPTDIGAANILLNQNFNGIPDFTGDQRVQVTSVPYVQSGIPSDFKAVSHSPTWAPSTGHNDRNEGIEILSSNADKSRGGTGKSAVLWRESQSGGFKNDKLILHDIPGNNKSVYAEFWIRFSPTFEPSGLSKIFRIYSYNESNSDNRGPFAFGTDGECGPMYYWDYDKNDFGCLNFMAFRGGPYSENYFEHIAQSGWPKSFISGDSVTNFHADMAGQAVGGSDPQIRSKVDDSLLVGRSGVIGHGEIFGPLSEGRWTKVAFYVSMNSAPGVADGVFAQWIDNHRIISSRSVKWLGSTAIDTTNIGWNVVGIGGNDANNTHADVDRYKEWYAIDDMLILDSLPVGLSVAA